MLPCGALERSNNPYIESIVELFVSKNLKGIFAMWVDWKENPEKGLRQFLKSISKLKAEFLSVREKK